jgi:hypothetical protein
MYTHGLKEEAILEALHKLYQEVDSNLGGVANYGFINKNKSNVVSYKRSTNTACIAQVAGYKGYFDTTPVAILYNIKDSNGIVTESRLAWCDWVVNKSIWKDVFVLKEHFNPIKNSSAVACTNINANYMATGLNILRLGIENKSLLDSWYSLFSNGVDPNLALCLSNHEAKFHDGNVYIPKNVHQYGHSIFSKVCSVEFMDFLVGKIPLGKVYTGGS